MWLEGDLPPPHVSKDPGTLCEFLILHEQAPAEIFCSMLWITASLRGNAAELFLHFSVASDLTQGLVSVSDSFLTKKLNIGANSTRPSELMAPCLNSASWLCHFMDACWKCTFHELFWLSWKDSDFLMCDVHVKLCKQIPLWAASAFPSPSPAAALVLFYMNLKAMCVCPFHR